jgi:hypothetical protein
MEEIAVLQVKLVELSADLAWARRMIKDQKRRFRHNSLAGVDVHCRAKT